MASISATVVASRRTEGNNGANRSRALVAVCGHNLNSGVIYIMDERNGVKKRIPGHLEGYLSYLEVSQALPAAHNQPASGFICHGVICGLQATLDTDSAVC